MNKYIIGHHGTFFDNVKSILKDGFRIRGNNRHYLGQGVYFYLDDMVQAKVWAFMQKRYNKHRIIAVLEALIDVSENALNLTKRQDNKKLHAFAKELLEAEDIIFNEEDSNINRCALLDAYTSDYGIKVVIGPFKHIRKEDKFIAEVFGLYYSEIQICVKDTNIIKDIKCVFCEKPRLDYTFNV